MTAGSASDADFAVHGAVAYGVAASRLYLPVEARFDPAVTDSELMELLPSEREFVWHPRVGLVGFEPHEILRIHDLIAIGTQRNASWSAATPGVSLAPRLLSIEPHDVPSLDDMLKAGREEIGSRSDEIKKLPKTKGEGLGKPLGAMGLFAVAHVAKFLAGLAPSGAISPTWIDSLKRWAGKTLHGVAAASLANRFKELQRLMSMLDENPEEGLKYALPLGGEAHRGVASPTDRLGRRDVDFRLNSLGGGRAADFWDVPQDMRMRLAARYRELAGREIRLGRYRRAAYIYAELLFDLQAAASALASGEHWREAAALYREKLNRPLEAARCLEQGGLWTEAIALYVELGHFEKAGDLHTQLGQLDEAHFQYRQEVTRLTNLHERVAAARILEFKMESVDEGIAILDEGWPHSTSASDCLHTLFAVYARQARHDDARLRVEKLRQSPHPLKEALSAVEVLTAHGENYPDHGVRTLAADASRVIASRALPEAPQAEAERLVTALGRLAQGDRLLRRDGQRYLQTRKRPRPPAPLVRSAGKITPIHRYRLTNELQVRAAARISDVIYVAGVRNDTLEVWRCLWAAEAGYPTARLPHAWKLSPGTRDRPILMAAHPAGDLDVLLHQVGSEPLAPSADAEFHAGGAFNMAVRCGAVSGVSRATVAAARSLKFTWLANVFGGDLNVVSYSSTGAPVFDRFIPGAAYESVDGIPSDNPLPPLW
ncbi:MAG: hypothetical protein KDA41_07545, partial [Planctomycetales bacterium]|nr:hypothetical protein [Planctomycetales bacterium]